MRNRRGWTLIELMVVMVVLGLLSSLAVLKWIDLSRTAFAAKIASQFTLVRLAAYNYEADHQNQWPAEQSAGIVPPEMMPYLPSGFSFDQGMYKLDWDNRTPEMIPYQVAISMTTTDARLMNVVGVNLGSKAPYFRAGNRLTFILIDPNGNY